MQERVTKKLLDTPFDWSNMKFPSSIKDIEQFEKNNPTYFVYVYGMEVDKKFYIFYKNKNFNKEDRIILNLLYFNDHFYPITNIDLFHKRIFTRYSYFVCQSCLSSFSKIDDLNFHKEYCLHDTYKVRMIMPPENTIYKFSNYHALKKYPFICYLDTESALVPIHVKNSNTTRYQRHDPIAFGLYFKSINEEEYYHFENVHQLLKKIEEIATRISRMKEYTIPQHPPFKKGEECCYMCQKPIIDKDFHYDHCHLTGKGYGFVHSHCNLASRKKLLLPIFAHNMSLYDCNAIIRGISRDTNVVAKNVENFIGFSFKVEKCTVRFLDSFKFLGSSLDKLAKNLPSSDKDCIKKHFPIHYNLFSRKGEFPYDYCTSIEKLKETKELPEKKEFYSKLHQRNTKKF